MDFYVFEDKMDLDKAMDAPMDEKLFIKKKSSKASATEYDYSTATPGQKIRTARKLGSVIFLAGKTQAETMKNKQNAVTAYSKKKIRKALITNVVKKLRKEEQSVMNAVISMLEEDKSVEEIEEKVNESDADIDALISGMENSVSFIDQE